MPPRPRGDAAANETRMGAKKMNKFLTELGAGLAWIWMTPEEARRLLQLDRQGAYAKADITFETRTERIAA